VARDVLASGGSLEDEATAAAHARILDPESLDDSGLRLPGVGDAASVVAKHPKVRAALLEFQRNFAAQEPGAVLDGRDIGTVVCPDAPVKIFVVADAEVRARRRFEEMRRRGEPVTYEGVLEVIRRRDARDSERADAPMKPAPDAMLLDTTNLGVEEAVAAALTLIENRLTSAGLSGGARR
jgi:CMP/dCMP kinase